MLGYFICFYLTVNPVQIAMWDSRFFIEVYSRLCQVLGQCRWAEKANEKRKKHESSEKVSEQKTAGREKGRACSILLNTSICPLPRPPRVIFQDRPALKELYDMSPDVLGPRFLEFLCVQQNSFYRAVRFVNPLKGFRVSKSQRNLPQKRNWE